MRSLLAFIVLVSFSVIPPSLFAQVTDSTVCDILANPQAFDGKIVRVKGTVIAGFEQFAIKGSGCSQPVNAIWLAYPHGTDGKAGPLAIVRLHLGRDYPADVTSVRRSPVALDKDKDFKNFDHVLSTPARTKGMCLGCMRFSVTATLVGRLDGVKKAGLVRDSEGKVAGLNGFGNLNRYNARLVLQSVSDISPREIDYANGEAAAPDDAASAPGSFTPGAPTADQPRRAAAAFGAEGEDNGVIINFGKPNEVPKDDSVRSNANSPDGLLFNVTFDSTLSKNPTMQVVISHVGTHIADIRSAATEIQNLSFYGAEFRAWQTSILSAAGANIKSLMLPGGYVIYSRSWPDSDFATDANRGISGFLVNWAGILNLPKP